MFYHRQFSATVLYIEVTVIIAVINNETLQSNPVTANTCRTTQSDSNHTLTVLSGFFFRKMYEYGTKTCS